jgi:hypothetical protein
MNVENLISLLQKCDPTAQVEIRPIEGGKRIEFVEYQWTVNTVLLLPQEPNWREDEEADGIEITFIKQECRFAEITWKDKK